MEQLTSFMVLSIDGGDRLSYSYDRIDPATGELIADNQRGTFFVVDEALRAHIEAVRAYIRTNKLKEDGAHGG